MTDRRSHFSFRRQLKLLGPLTIVWAVGGVGLVIIALQDAVPVETLLLDSSHLAGTPWYSGLVSNLGILGWTMAAVTAAAGAWVAARTGRPSAAWFLGTGSAVGTLLLTDDLLLLHSNLLPQLTGMTKATAMVLICLPSIAWAVVFRDEIGRTRWLTLAAAVGGFTVSVMLDLVASAPTASGLLAEDGAKFLGVLAWCAYFTLTAVDIAESTIRTAMAAPGTGAESRPANQSRNRSLTDVLDRV